MPHPLLDRHATLRETSEYFRRCVLPVPPVALGRTGLFVSPVGFGGYRIEEEEPQHAAALKLALRSGCNLIDTSSNYGGGSSERLVGKIVRELVESREMRREEIVLVTKVGYVQGSNLDLVRRRKKEGHA